MKKLISLLVLGCWIGLTGCYRTTYKNLGAPPAPASAATTVSAEQRPSSWQHFFLFGWVPEKHLRADEICQSSGGVQEIETEQTFLQGFLAAICSFYINIYSPYTGQVVCADGSRTD